MSPGETCSNLLDFSDSEVSQRSTRRQSIAKRLNVDAPRGKEVSMAGLPRNQDKRRSLGGGSAKTGMTALKHEGVNPTVPRGSIRYLEED